MNNQKIKQKVYTTLAKLLITIMVFGLFTIQLPLPAAFATENEDITATSSEALGVNGDEGELVNDLGISVAGLSIQPMLVGTVSNANVTDKIEFTATLSNSSGKEIATGSDPNFKPYYWSIFYFQINWETVDSNLGFEDGDYFTFTVPEIFSEVGTVNMMSDEDIWGVITFGTATDSNGSVTATATFSDKINSQTALSGSIQLSAIYKSRIKGEPVEWVFDFSGGCIYEYTGTNSTEPNPNYDMTKPKLKRGEIVGEESGKYLWTICLNQEMKAWTGPVTVTDTIGDGHKLTKYLLINSINQNNGSYGVDNTPYFQIYEYDWNKMRDDYNDLFGDDSNHSGDTVSHDKYANGYVYQRYKTATDSNGNVSYIFPTAWLQPTCILRCVVHTSLEADIYTGSHTQAT